MSASRLQDLHRLALPSFARNCAHSSIFLTRRLIFYNLPHSSKNPLRLGILMAYILLSKATLIIIKRTARNSWRIFGPARSTHTLDTNTEHPGGRNRITWISRISTKSLKDKGTYGRASQPSASHRFKVNKEVTCTYYSLS